MLSNLVGMSEFDNVLVTIWILIIFLLTFELICFILYIGGIFMEEVEMTDEELLAECCVHRC